MASYYLTTDATTSATSGSTTTNGWYTATYEAEARDVQIWGSWTTATGSTTSDPVWIRWQPVYQVNPEPIVIQEFGNPNPIYIHPAPVPEPTPEELEAARLQAIERQREYEERALVERQAREARERERVEADCRADELLLSLLNAKQQKEYKEKNIITIYKDNKPKYRLHKQRSYGIVELDDSGKAKKEHCVVCNNVPLADQMAAHVLYLQSNPEQLLRVANTRPL